MDIKDLCKKIEESLGIRGYEDIYFFCARIGNNRSDFDYGFNWEPFRENMEGQVSTITKAL